MNRFLACGIGGPTLEDGERRLLEELGPGGIVLFARNVADRDQLAALVRTVRELPGPPHVAIDLEGGRVNRLERLIGPLPTPAAAAAAGAGAVRALGEALGAACAHFGIGVDYAPALEVARPGGFLAAEGRCLGDSPAAVVAAAAVLLEGLERFGVAGCLKHYPGLGSGAVDSHRELPLLSEAVREDSTVFAALARPERGVMVAHALAPALGEAFAPASLAASLVGRLAHVACGPLIADDLEMGALAAFGSLPERAAAALLAGCHQVLVCNALDQRQPVVDHVRAWAREPAMARALELADATVAPYGQGALREVRWDEVVRLADRARRLAAGHRP